MRRADELAAPQNGLPGPAARRPIFGRFSGPLGPFVRFNEASNRVECSPPERRLTRRIEGGGDAADSQSADCGVGVSWRKKLRGKSPENLCAAACYTWTICPSSTRTTPHLLHKKRPVYNTALIHSLSTALESFSATEEAPQRPVLQPLALVEAPVLPESKAPLLL